MADLSSVAGTWVIDNTHTNLGFQVRHAMIAKVRGSFTEFEGSFTIDGANPANSTAELTIQTASITTRNDDRDNHLRSGDFFDAEANPVITFKSTGVEVKGDDILVSGDLTIKGVTKPVTVTYELAGTSIDPWGNTRVGFEGEAKINRKDFGLTWNAALETGGVMVGDEIKLSLDVEAVKQADVTVG